MDSDETWDKISKILDQWGLVDDRNYEATADIFNFLISEGVIHLDKEH